LIWERGISEARSTKDSKDKSYGNSLKSRETWSIS